jgi:hypothetical protein
LPARPLVSVRWRSWHPSLGRSLALSLAPGIEDLKDNDGM